MTGEIVFNLNVPASFAFENLADPSKFVRIHPLVYKMEHLSGSTYKVYEKIGEGFFAIRFTYTAKVSSDPHSKVIHIDAKVFSLVRIQISFLVREQGPSNSQVLDQFSVRSVLPVGNHMKRVFMKQHQILFDRLSKLYIDSAGR